MRAVPNLHHVKDIFEIRIRKSDWVHLKQVAACHKLTYSAVVRLCIFRLEKSQPLRHDEVYFLKRRMQYLYSFPGKKNQGLHRHLLCLYGKDAAYLRVLAYEYGLTVTMLVRMAIDLFLLEIEMELWRGKLDVVQNGIKIFSTIQPAKSIVMEFHNNGLKFQHFKMNDYWPWKPFVVFGKG